MKTITILLAALAAMFYVGCSNGSGSVVGIVPPENGTVETELSFVFEEFGEGKALPKIAALEDTLRISLLSDSDGPLIRKDLIPIDGWSNTMKVIYRLNPGETYRVLAFHGNQRFSFRDGKTEFTVPEDADTFAVSLVCEAKILLVGGVIDLGNSILSDQAIGMKFKFSLVPTGSTAPDSFTIERNFAVGSKDTIMFAETLFVGYAWDADLSILCNNDSIEASGRFRTPVLVGGEDYNFSIVVAVRNNKKTVAKIAVIPQPIGRAIISVVFSEEETET